MAVPGPGDGDKDKKKGAVEKVMNIANSGKNQTNVETYDIVSGESSGRTVQKNSRADRVSQEFGKEITFGPSVSQAKPTKKADVVSGTNRNTGATMSTYGNLSPNFNGRAKDKNNRIVDFSNNNNDSRRGEKYRLF